MIELDRLLACALGELDDIADAEVEEHVLSCSACAAKLARFIRLGPAIADVVLAGGLTMPVTSSLVERLDAAGLLTRRYVIAPGEIVPCTVDARDLYAFTTLSADFSGVSRVDLMRGTQRLPDVPFDAGANRLYLITSARVLRTFPSMQLPLELFGVAADGSERSLGRYTLDHTAFSSGSGPA